MLHCSTVRADIRAGEIEKTGLAQSFPLLSVRRAIGYWNPNRRLDLHSFEWL